MMTDNEHNIHVPFLEKLQPTQLGGQALVQE